MKQLIIRKFTQALDYESTWEAMRDFTDQRDDNTPDELWLLEHPPVFTQGQAGKPEHILNPNQIPVVQTDRGGQVTYHGPGQLVAYTLFDINRLGISTRPLVRTIEQVVIDCLAELQINAEAREDAPGIYVNDAKICSIGLRVRRGRSYHGIAFNIDMDLTPFSYINPCGYRGMRMTQVKDLAPQTSINDIQEKIIPYFIQQFGYNQPVIQEQDRLHEPAI
ncbi:MAG: lipoyl(octanoyl) transferase LipB [Coxiellaceae bacterium]|nr:lipoyl(octanoyl) transferase LipB [Coxiellaceae bacterium]